VISQKQRPLSDNTKYAQEKEIHAPGGIRNRNPSKLASADARLRTRGHWDRQHVDLPIYNFKLLYYAALNPLTPKDV
jgi:hypothetical protein